MILFGGKKPLEKYDFGDNRVFKLTLRSGLRFFCDGLLICIFEKNKSSSGIERLRLLLAG